MAKDLSQMLSLHVLRSVASLVPTAMYVPLSNLENYSNFSATKYSVKYNETITNINTIWV